ncbi:MAG TPA: DUF4421 family protein [Bdellovibrionales bacterium]|nr:DUF4421 family protein [Bdellovibrionales bacterium]
MLSLLLISMLALAEDAPEVHPVEASFKTVEKSWLTVGLLEFPYVPNFQPRLGIKASYKDCGARVSLGVNLLSESEHARRGKSTQDGIALNTYWRQHAFDIYLQRFEGFYVSDPFTETKPSKPARFPQLPDTHVTNWGVNWYYATRPERYSLKAAFDQSEFQLKSGGSWIFNPFFNHLEVYLGSVFIPGSDPGSITELPNLASGRFDTLGLAAGYGYTYIRKAYFATAQGALGPGFQYQRIRRSDANDSEVSTAALKINMNLATGWNYPGHVAGMKVLVDSLYSRVLDTQITSSLITIQFFYGTRF